MLFYQVYYTELKLKDLSIEKDVEISTSLSLLLFFSHALNISILPSKYQSQMASPQQGRNHSDRYGAGLHPAIIVTTMGMPTTGSWQDYNMEAAHTEVHRCNVNMYLCNDD